MSRTWLRCAPIGPVRASPPNPLEPGRAVATASTAILNRGSANYLIAFSLLSRKTEFARVNPRVEA